MDKNKIENDFQIVFSHWKQHKDYKSWNDIFYFIYNCCSNICKAKMKGIRNDPEIFEGKIMDATLHCLEDIKKGMEPHKLSSWCYFRCLKSLYRDKNEERVFREADIFDEELANRIFDCEMSYASIFEIPNRKI